MVKAVIAIHGGAGAITRAAMSDEKEQHYRQALLDIVTHGQQMLAQGASALDVVTEAVRQLEECPLFNAGKGAVFTHQGTHELDACVMDGRTLNVGAVAGVCRVRNPVLAARAVLEQSPHVLFIGEGAEQFAEAQGLTPVAADYFSTPDRWEQLQRALNSDEAVLDHDGAAGGDDPLDPDRKFGTVGAVALDLEGNLAAATSTGGMTNKQAGRVGDSPLPGAGCYASNDSVAVSCTGTGEVFIRTLAAYDVAAQMRYAGRTLQQASVNVIHDSVLELGGSGGLIAVDREGNVALPFNSEGMYRASARVGEAADVAIYRDS
ncbi:MULTISPECIES: isoaspartyl peptidase/L-asparaginase family protein [Pantoea]|uniref:isoaspartyl peptidase/L-asparaginase family protein n=1 Tax=Pantoea TaxID=53335 RepID=UPI001F312E94|nr:MULTISPECIES: isoaspartyl peptidase/L-asparaginase [Pantoea]UIL51255.1 isoaspartyl peptidase/L-asparaginase [Pantoea agglomerans]